MYMYIKCKYIFIFINIMVLTDTYDTPITNPSPLVKLDTINVWSYQPKCHFLP